jgi:hypothetical protein
MANTLPSPRQITLDIEPVVPGKTREPELQHDLAGALRPVMASLGFFQPLQFATDIDEHLGKLGAHRIERAHDALLAAMTSSRKDAASSGAPRRDRPEGAGADQFAVTLGLRLANQ